MAYNLERLGREITDDGRTYTAVSFQQHERADGTPTELAVMEGQCAECGGPFRFTVPVQGSRFKPNRRCAAHRRRGAKAK